MALVLLAASLTRPALEQVLVRALSPALALRNTLVASDATLLRAEVSRLEAAVADRELLYRENLDLKARLGRPAPLFSEKSGAGRVLAAVVLRPPATPYDSLLIDAGEAEGLAIGDLVSAGGSLLIGRVSQTYEHQSRVTLFSATGETHAALLLSSVSTAFGVPISALGQGGGSFVAEVPAGTDAAAGDYVAFPGIASGFTATVSHVERHEGESFIRLYARLPVNPFELRYVEIWK